MIDFAMDGLEGGTKMEKEVQQEGLCVFKPSFVDHQRIKWPCIQIIEDVLKLDPYNWRGCAN